MIPEMSIRGYAYHCLGEPVNRQRVSRLVRNDMAGKYSPTFFCFSKAPDGRIGQPPIGLLSFTVQMLVTRIV